MNWWSEDVRSLGRLAFEVVFGRKYRQMRGKGRQLSARAIRQWLRTDWINQIDIVVCAAAKRAEKIVDRSAGQEFNAAVRACLRDDLARATRGRGRPSLHRHGLLAPSAKRGRPRVIEEGEALLWADRVLGARCALHPRVQARTGAIRNVGAFKRYLVANPRLSRNLGPIAGAIVAIGRPHEWGLPPEDRRPIERRELTALVALYRRTMQPNRAAELLRV